MTWLFVLQYVNLELTKVICFDISFMEIKLIQHEKNYFPFSFMLSNDRFYSS